MELENSTPKERNDRHPSMTSGEITALWTGYLGDSLARCVLVYFLSHVEDAEVRPLLEYALGLAEEHLAFKQDLFTREGFPIPHGFTDEDVRADAPRLFSDMLMLYYRAIWERQEPLPMPWESLVAPDPISAGFSSTIWLLRPNCSRERRL